MSSLARRSVGIERGLAEARAALAVRPRDPGLWADFLALQERAGRREEGLAELAELRGPTRGDPDLDAAYHQLLRLHGFLAGEPFPPGGEPLLAGDLDPSGELLVLAGSGCLELWRGRDLEYVGSLPWPPGGSAGLSRLALVPAGISLLRAGEGEELEFWSHPGRVGADWVLRGRAPPVAEVLALDGSGELALVREPGGAPGLRGCSGERLPRLPWNEAPVPGEEVLLRGGALARGGERAALLVGTRRQGQPGPEGWMDLHDLPSGRRRRRLLLPLRDLETVRFAPDGASLVVGSLPGSDGAFGWRGLVGNHSRRRRGSPGIWSLPDLDGAWRGLAGPRVLELAYRDRGRRVLTLGDHLLEWDLEAGVPTHALPLGSLRAGGEVAAVVPAEELPRALVVGEKGARILDLAGGLWSRELRASGAPLTRAVFLGADALATRDAEGTLRRWSWPQGQLLEARPCWPCALPLEAQVAVDRDWGRLRGGRSPALRELLLSGIASTDLWAVDPRGPGLLLASAFGEVRWLEGLEGRERWRTSLPGSDLRLAYLDPGGRSLWTWTESDGRLTRLERDSGREEAAWLLPRPGGVATEDEAPVFRPDGDGGTFLIRGAAYQLSPRGGRFQPLVDPGEGHRAVVLDPEGVRVAWLDSGGDLEWRSLEDPDRRGRVPGVGDPRCILLGPGGRELLVSRGPALQVLTLTGSSR